MASPSKRGRDRGRSGAGDPAKSPQGRWLALVGVLAVGVVIASVAAVALNQPDEAEPGGGTAATVPAGAEGDFPIVAYRGADRLGAEELDFGELLGTGTPVVLNFWAGQCPPCRAEMPDFQAIHDRYADEFLLVGVDIGPFVGLGTRDSALALLDELDITYPTAYTLDADVVRDHNVLGMPTTIFYDGDGAEVGRHAGLLTEQAFEARVRELIGATS